MAHSYIEIIYDSRRLAVQEQSMDESIVAILCIDQTVTTSFPKFMDFNDDVRALEYAYTIFPLNRLMPSFSGKTSDDKYMLRSSITMEQIGRNQWRATARYGYNLGQGHGGDLPNEDGVLPYYKLGFTIGGGTKRIYKALEVKAKAVATDAIPGAQADNMFGGIGISKDGAEGALVPDSAMRLQITAYFQPDKVDLAYTSTVRDIVAGANGTGSYNNAPYMGYPKGEVQLISASGGGLVFDIKPITFEFSISSNVASYTDEGFAEALDALGHDLIDYSYKKEGNDNTKTMLMKPFMRRVLRVASEEDYSRLKLPV